ncbi:hypothetical protein C8Q80DRAFT_1269302 [Daedaleopsis nitida]|nr:hypothetical protein C8Q80DRAFT_1269302 [Daedaleopsis nitida]
MKCSTYGVTSAQAMWYFMHYPNDRRFLKYMAQVVCNAATIALIQSFYAFRVWTLSKNKLLVGTLSFFVLGDLSLGLLLFIKSVQAKSIDDLATLTAYDIAISSTTAATDVLLCSALVVLLASSRTANAGSNRMIRKLMFYTIETGCLTSICSILSLITVIVLPTTALYVMFYYIGSRMYSASLLTMLNAREGLRNTSERHYTMDSMPQITSGRRSGDGEGRKGSASAPPREILVSIQRDTTVMFEEGDQKAKDVYHKAFRYKKPKMPAGDTSSARGAKLAQDAVP